MDVLHGINNFLIIINENWTTIIVTIGLLVALFNKIRDFVQKSNEEKVEIAKVHIRESILKLITEAELDYEEWSKAGSIKRSQVIQEIYLVYPILEKVIDQESIIKWIDNEIDNSLETLREIIATNSTDTND